MKKLFYYISICFLSISVFSCDNDYDTIFEETPDQRLQQALDEYNSLIINAPQGWKAELTTGINRTYFYYFDFNEDGTVTMVSDFSQTTAGTPASSSWVIKALQKPTLSFNTYSYIHLPADPEGDVNGGANGEGLISDFEFSFSSVSEDSVILTGVQRCASLKLTPATENERSAILDQEILNVLDGVVQTTAAHKSMKMVLPDGDEVPVVIDVAQRVFGAQYQSENGGDILSFQTGFNFEIEGIKLSHPFEIKGYTIQYLFWDGEQSQITVDLDGETRVVGFDEPFIFEVSTPLSGELGEAYAGVLIPQGSGENPLSGQSDSFIASYNAAASYMASGPYQLTLREMELNFDASAKTMNLNVYISQTNNGSTSIFLAQYGYSYSVDADGLIKFSFLGANDNGWLIYGDLYDILFHIESDNFSTEYIGGDLNLIGGFFSEESPEFYFSGYLLRDM
ncbi:DUF4302 domain-containing protein [Fulvivirga ligni]|uniref:DUF4302 domain-containing protein n=1 Tax=Fulvivirga ligni TaxID=2904246 RepID=UPI001F2E6404|nr:DUF4302 domain-containing protein [Fulvivirga ligni]UII23175.1 DUF4302 domain-containing protein [Fulvivirga ligni]